MLEKEKQTRRRTGGQTGFVQHVTKGNSKSSTYESSIDFLEGREIDMPVNGRGSIVQQVVSGNLRIAEKGFEHGIVRFVFFFMEVFLSGHGRNGLRLRK